MNSQAYFSKYGMPLGPPGCARMVQRGRAVVLFSSTVPPGPRGDAVSAPTARSPEPLRHVHADHTQRREDASKRIHSIRR